MSMFPIETMHLCPDSLGSNREQQLINMRKKYDEKVAIPLDRRRRHQGPQAPTEKYVYELCRHLPH